MRKPEQLHSEITDLHWDAFRAAFVCSLSSMGDNYLLIPRYDPQGTQYVQRERAFCYELYHQLRLRLGDSFPYVLHGELDKSGQEFIRTRMNTEPVPDFVVHRPSLIEPGDQLVSIEVKSSHGFTERSGQQDVDKLVGFVKEVGYLHGLLLVFGSCADLQRVENVANSLEISEKHIHVLWHSGDGEPIKAIRSTEEWICPDKSDPNPNAFWTDWRPFYVAGKLMYICAPYGPGVYELRLRSTGELVLLESAKNVVFRLTSMLPRPGGQDHRENQTEREFVMQYLHDIEYRTLACLSEDDAQAMNWYLRQSEIYKFPR